MDSPKQHRLDWRNGKLFYDDKLLADDELEAARVMLKRNLASRNDSFTTYRGDMACLTTGVGWAADRVVRSNPGGTPVFRLTTPAFLPAGRKNGDPA